MFGVQGEVSECFRTRIRGGALRLLIFLLAGGGFAVQVNANGERIIMPRAQASWRYRFTRAALVINDRRRANSLSASMMIRSLTFHHLSAAKLGVPTELSAPDHQWRWGRLLRERQADGV